jgi:hypothetical protein
MAIKNVSGHQLEIGDHVRINIPVLEAGDLDGVEVTASGENYWRYICEHPDEIYTVTALNFNYETCPYILSGFLSGTTFAADELIHVAKAETQFEVLKNATINEMPDILFSMIQELDKDTVITKEELLSWLNSKP